MTEVEEATAAECVQIAARRIVAAIRELNDDDSHAADHVRMYLTDALVWLPDGLEPKSCECHNPKAEARPPHPDCMIAKGPR